MTAEDFETTKNAETKIANAVAAQQELRNRVSELEGELEDARDDLAIAESQNEIAKEIIDPFMGDPSPIDSQSRKMYVAQVAGLHKDILEPKLKHMISNAHQMLEESSNDRDYDLSIKGVVYALREMIRWGNTMTNEYLAYVGDDDPSKPEKVNNDKK